MKKLMNTRNKFQFLLKSQPLDIIGLNSMREWFGMNCLIFSCMVLVLFYPVAVSSEKSCIEASNFYATGFDSEKNILFSPEFLKRNELTPEKLYKIAENGTRAREEREARERKEFIQNVLIAVVVLVIIVLVIAKLKKSRRYQFVKDYAYMLKLIDIAKSQNTPEHSIAVLCRGEKSVSVVNEIYAFCITHENLNEVVRRHNATLSDFQRIYEELTIFCCVGSGDKFIPVSTFFFTRSLDYVLSNRITNYNSGMEVSGNLIRYFDSML